MPNEKNIKKARVINKHDTEENWLKLTNFIPKAAELIVYEPDENYEYFRFKFGDGVTEINTLPFSSAESAYGFAVEHGFEGNIHEFYNKLATGQPQFVVDLDSIDFENNTCTASAEIFQEIFDAREQGRLCYVSFYDNEHTIYLPLTTIKGGYYGFSDVVGNVYYNINIYENNNHVANKYAMNNIYIGDGDIPPFYTIQIIPSETGDYRLPNPYKLYMIGSTAIAYDGSEEVNINIPDLIGLDNYATKEDLEYEIATFDFIKVVEQLPSSGFPNRIYLVPKTDTQDTDLFDEWLWINKGTEEEPNWNWEWITTKQVEVDLTPYATKEYTDTQNQLFLEKVYPVGSIYLSTNALNPSELFGFGTWVQIVDKFLIGAGNKYSINATGGEEAHKLTYKELPESNGRIVMHNSASGTNIAGVAGCFSATSTVTGAYRHGGTLLEAATSSIGIIDFTNGGKDQSHNNMPPYLAVYMWQRTA